MQAQCTFAMARFRIKQRPSFTTPSRAIFAVEKRLWFWWREINWYLDLEDAEHEVETLWNIKPVETKVIKEYD